MLAGGLGASTRVAPRGMMKFGRLYRPTKPVAGVPGEMRNQNATVPERSNSQLVQSIGKRADAWGTRKGLASTGSREGTFKHGYAEKLLKRYQKMYGDRGLRAEVRYRNGVEWRSGDPLKGSIRLDVVQGPLDNPTAIWDYKFGNAHLSASRINQIRTGAGLGSDVPIMEVKPW